MCGSSQHLQYCCWLSPGDHLLLTLIYCPGRENPRLRHAREAGMVPPGMAEQVMSPSLCLRNTSSGICLRPQAPVLSKHYM